MQTTNATGLQTPATADETNRRQISGPHLEFDQYGRATGATFYRCEACGTESINRSDVESECECVREEVLA
jgi:hypothetical protein